MRKGSRRNDWTVSDTNYLIQNAGRIPKRDICQLLKRSSKSVERKAAWLREHGVPINLRCYVSRLDTCPSCGRMTGRIGRDGVCEICKRQEQLRTINARIANIFPHLSLKDRDEYEKTESECESRHDPLPQAPDMQGLTYYQQQKRLEDYTLAAERVVVGNLKREIKARQKRKERMEEKVKINGGLYVSTVQKGNHHEK